MAHQLEQLLHERIAILDGAMGTMIQAYELDEAAFRDDQFREHETSLQGCNDLLSVLAALRFGM